MSTALTAIFGSEIKVTLQPLRNVRQYSGFAGAHGLLGLYLGTRGRQLTIKGTLASGGGNYTAARTALAAVIAGLETYLAAEPADYSHYGETYTNVVFDKFNLLPDSRGKTFHWTSEGYCTCEFICTATCLA